MIGRAVLSSVVVVFLVVVVLAAGVSAQALPDPVRAKALDKCHILLERTGTKFAVKKLKSLAKCSDGILKCLTKPDVARCVDQARERCGEQLRAGAAAEAVLVDAVVRKCGSDLSVAELLSPAGLDFESVRDDCEQRFGITLADLASVGTCLARQQSCELERLFAVAAPRAATLLAVAGVDPVARAALTCLTDRGGADEHVADPRAVGRPLERCGRAVENTALKLVDASLKALGRCLDTRFTCVQVKTDPAAAPACAAKAQKRCNLELANLGAAAARPGPAIRKACETLDYDVLRAAEGLRLFTLDADCTAAGAGAPTTLATLANCLVRTHRCGVAALARFKSPRADALLADVGTSLAALCPVLATPATPTTTPAIVTPTANQPTATPTALPTPTGTSTGPTSTANDPTPTAIPTVLPTSTATATEPTPTATADQPTASPTALLTPTATATEPTPTSTGPTPTPGCPDTFEPNQFPDAPKSLNGQCGAGCTDDGYELVVEATIDDAGDDDFYDFDVTDLPGHNFSLQVRLSNIPDDTNYDLYLYRFDGNGYEPLDQSTNNGTGSEAASFDGDAGDNSGHYAVEVRRVAGASCDLYRLEISNPN